MQTISSNALAAVCGGADAKALDARATACNALVQSLYANQQHVPSGFTAACGDLNPKIRDGGRVVKNVFERLETR